MKVLFLTPHPIEGASSRFRVYQFIPYLEREGHECHVRPFISSELYFQRLQGACSFTDNVFGFMAGLSRRIRDIQLATRCDAVFIHREALPYGPPILERILTLLGCKIGIDFDDALFLPAPGLSPKLWARWMKPPSRVSSTLKLSSHAVVGNSFLADYARQYCESVSVIPTVIDSERYRPRPVADRKGPIVIGWMGSPSTVEYLEILVRPLRRLSENYDIRIEVVGAKIPAEWKSSWSCRSFNLAREVDDLWSFDIGIMPQPNDQWSRGKCALKALQYMGVGIPAVCSPVGVVNGMIRDGQNGVLANSEEDWFQKLERLIIDPDLRAEIGRRGREYVVRKYSVDAVLADFCGMLESLASDRRGEVVRNTMIR